MKNFKKLFSILAIVAFLGTTVPTTVLGATYSDELEGAYDYAYSIGITTQPTIDSANMYGNLIRSHMAKMMVNYAKEVLGKTPDTSLTCEFTDIANQSEELQGYIKEACQLGLMGVGISAFNPNGVVTRAQFGTVLSRALYGDTYNGGDPYYVNHLNALKAAGIMNKIDNPNMPEVRGYVMLMMQRAAGAETPAVCETPENVLSCWLELDTCPTECQNVTPVVPGFITVSSVGSVAAQYVPKNAVNKKIGTIKITAGENDTTVTSLTFKHAGLADADHASIKLLTADGATATNEKTFSKTTNDATVRFSPKLVLKAGSSMTFDAVVSLAADQNEHHEFSVTSAAVVNGSASGFPITLANLNTTSYAVSTTTDIVLTEGTSPLKAGKAQEKLFTVDINNPNVDINVNGLTISATSNVDLDDAFANMKAYYEGAVVGTVTMTDDEIVIAGLDIDAIDGDDVSLDIKADTSYIGSGETIDLNVNANDLLAKEISNGEQVRYTYDAAAKITLDLNDADFTLTNMMDGAKTYAPGTNSIELFNTKITSSNEFDVTDYTLKLTVSTGTAHWTGFSNSKVTIYVNGVDYDWTGGNMNFTDEDDFFNVAPGAPATIRVVGSAKTNFWDLDILGKKFTVELVINKLKNVNDDANDSFAVSSTSKKWDVITIDQGRFTVSKQSSIPTNKTVLEGSSQNVAFFNIKATSENQVLKGLTADLTSTDFATGFSQFVTRLDLMQGTTVVKSITDEDDLSGSTVEFTGLSYSLTKDTTVPFTIRATLKDGEVTNLGNAFAVDVDPTTMYVVRASKTSVATSTTSTLIDGKSYQIASVIPVVTILAQDAKITTVQMKNDSQYDLRVKSMKVEFAMNRDGGSYIERSGTANLLDTKNGSIIYAGTASLPGTQTFTFTGDVTSSDTLDRVIELIAPAYNITDADYTVTVKELTFDYLDEDGEQSAHTITESYNVSK